MLRNLLNSQPWLVAIAVVTLLAGGPAAAQTYGVGAGSSNFGTVASAASGNTVFTVDAGTGAVGPPSSGNGGRVSTHGANATVTISCSGSTGNCNNKNVNVRVGLSGSPTGRLNAIQGFSVASGTATVSNVNTSNPTNITFTLTPIGANSSKTFKLGFTVSVKGDNSGSPAGNAGAGYFVSVAAAPNTPASSGTSGSLSALVYRSLSVTKGSDLTFGRIVRPLSGAGTATIRLNANGTKANAAPATWLSSPAAIRASYTVTGDSGRQLSVSIPSFTMVRAGGGSLTVTPLPSYTSQPALNGSNPGTVTFFVGGQFSLPDNTPGGSYSGMFTTVISYN